MGTDFEEIGALSSQSLDWGPGGPVDEKNRSQGAILYNEKYGGYDALFLAADEPVVYMTFDEGYEYGLTPTFLSMTWGRPPPPAAVSYGHYNRFPGGWVNFL